MSYNLKSNEEKNKYLGRAVIPPISLMKNNSSFIPKLAINQKMTNRLLTRYERTFLPKSVLLSVLFCFSF